MFGGKYWPVEWGELPCLVSVGTSIKRKNRPWISKEIRDSIKLKEKAYKVAKISGRL